jgi:polysaccharide deacetylase family protein (PEP-CTERM system associated)
MTVTNALTVDVEDYFHVSAFAETIDRQDWDHYPRRVESNTQTLLQLFGKANVKATFFVLGWVAERCPSLVSDIARAGHEVACHGYSHELVYRQTPEVFRDETRRAKQILEDIIQKPVEGYRAASYSITKRSLWALDILAELEFRYDSSIFPVHHDRYGMPDAQPVPHVLRTPGGYPLVEFPLSTYRLWRYRLPVAGGGYFRLFPYWLTRHALASINTREHLPFIFYLHPWEIDPEQPRIKAGLASRFRHYQNLERCQTRLERLLNEFSFGTVEQVLGQLDLKPSPPWSVRDSTTSKNAVLQ